MVDKRTYSLRAIKKAQATDPDDSDRLAEIEARLEARAPGEWRWDVHSEQLCSGQPDGKFSILSSPDDPPLDDDAALIALAPADLEWAVAEIKRLTEKIATYERGRTIPERIDALRDLAGEHYAAYAQERGGVEAACDELRGRDPVATPPGKIRVQDLPVPMTAERLAWLDEYTTDHPQRGMFDELLMEARRARWFEDYHDSAFQEVAAENKRILIRNGELLKINNDLARRNEGLSVRSARLFNGDAIREELADLCHKQWSGWMEYLFSKGGV